MKKLLSFIAILSICITAMAQCPNFMDLSPSNAALTAYYGTTSNPFANTGIVPGRHTLITTPGTDPRTCGNLQMMPDGVPVIKLGNEQVGAQAEALVYRFTPDINNTVLMLKYAVVLEDPGHISIQQPRFRLRVLDEDGKLLEECAQYDVTAAPNNPGFQTCQIGSRAIRWRNWTNLGVDLSRFVGKIVQVELTTFDCSPTAHFGYAYFSASCMPNTLQVTSCEGGSFTLEAPDNFQSYLWSNGSTGRTATFTGVANNTQITCTVTSATGCQFTLFALVTDDLDINDLGTHNDIICEGEPYALHTFNLPPQPAGQWWYQNVVINPDCSVDVINLNLTVVERFNHIRAAICHGNDYTLNGFDIIQPAPGIRRDTVLVSEDICNIYNVLELRVDMSFDMPDLIQGDGSPCSDEETTYFFLGAETLSSFEWEFPDNAVFTSSYRRPQVTVYFTDDTPGVIKLHGENGCGSGTATKPVNPRQTYVMQFTAEVCQGQVFNDYGFNLGRQDSVGYFIYGKDLISSLGCDSVVNLGLSVLPTPVVRIEPKDTVLCNAGDPITLWALIDAMQSPDTATCSGSGDYFFVYIPICGLNYLWEWEPGGSSTNPSISVNPATTTTYTVTVTTEGTLGCSATVSETVIVDPGIPVVIFDTICYGETYDAHGITTTLPGTHHTTINADGCNIDLTVELYVRPLAKFLISEDICAGERFTEYGFDLTLFAEGLFVDTVHFISSKGCDSLVIFNMNVLPQKVTIIDDEICQFLYYNAHGFDLGIQHFNGLQTHRRGGLFTTQTCDSTVFLNLRVLPVPQLTANNIIDVCVGDTINLFHYTNSTNASADIEFFTDPARTNPVPNPANYEVTGDVTIYVTASLVGGCDNPGVFTITVTTTGCSSVIARNDIVTNVCITTVIDVLANDDLGECDETTIALSIVTPPTRGTATVTPDNKISYTPIGYTGTDSLRYAINCNGATDTATVYKFVIKCPADSTDIIAIPDTVCFGDRGTIRVSSPTVANPVFFWYYSQTAPEPFHRGNQLTTGSLEQNVTYYVAVVGTNKYENFPRHRRQVQVIVKPPVIPVLPKKICVEE